MDIATDAGGDLQHALGDVMFGLARFQRALDLINKRGRVLAQIEARRVDDLELQLDAKGKRLGAVKIR